MSMMLAGIPSYNGFSQAPWLDHNYCSQSFNGSFTQPLEAFYPPHALAIVPVSTEQSTMMPYQPATQSPSPTTIVLKVRKSNTKVVVETLCAICDGTASGYHYGVASCTGCWIFFRQTIITGDAERLRCPYQGKCAVSKEWNACRRCRFDKCLLEGMDMAGKSLVDCDVCNV